MKKFLLIVIGTFAFNTAYALDLDWESDVSIVGPHFNMSVDQDDNTFAVGARGVTVSTSDNVDIGIAYGGGFIPGLKAGMYYEYTTSDDNILGVRGSASGWGLSLTPEVEWNINQSEFDGSLAADAGLYGLSVFGSVDMNINDFKFTGSEAGVKWDVALSDAFTITPNIALPFDEDWNSGDFVAGISIKITLPSLQ